MSKQSAFAIAVNREVKRQIGQHTRARMQLAEDAAFIAANEVLGLGAGRAKEFGETFCRVAICGRPVSRYLDNGLTLEITRLCTDGTSNACSKLYSSCVKVARAMGYEKVITYILQSENGSSLKASNFVCEGEAGRPMWTGKRKRDNGVPQEMKQRYVFYITGTGRENIFREAY